MKFIKISLYSILIILILLVASAGIFVMTYDTDALKSTIVKTVKQRIGRELTIGSIQPTIFPWLGATLRDVSLSNATGFSAEKMLTFKQLDMHLAVLPLLKREVSIDTLRISGLVLFLEKNKQALTNWTDLLNAANEGQPNEPAGMTEEKQQAAESRETKNIVSNITWEIKGVDIQDANLHWHDAVSGKSIEIQKTNIKTGAVAMNLPLQLNINSQLDLPESGIRLSLDIQTRMNFDVVAQRVKLDNLSLLVDATIKNSPLEQMQLDLQAPISVDILQQQLTSSSFKLVANLFGAELPNKQLKVIIAGNMAADLNKQFIQVKPLTIDLQGLKINSQIQVKKLSESPELSGQLNLLAFSPSAWAESLAITLPKMRSDSALTHASMMAKFNANNKRVSLSDVKLKLDQSIIDMDIQVDDFENPEIKTNIKVDRINLDDYLSPLEAPSNNKPSQVASKKKSDDMRIELPVDMLRELNVNSRLHIKNITAFDIAMKNVNAQLNAKQGRIGLSSVKAQLLGGEIAASTTLDVRQKIPQYNMQLTSKKIEIQQIVSPMLQQISGQKNFLLSGASNVDVNVITRGESVKQLMSKLNGTLAIDMNQAKLHGVDTKYFVYQNATKSLKKYELKIPENLIRTYQPKTVTALQVARFSANITGGVLNNNDFLLKSSKMKITGAGDIDLPNEKLNYRLNVNWLDSKNRTLTDKLIAMPVPINIRGTFMQPDISVDRKTQLNRLKKIIKAEAKNKIKAKAKSKVKRKVDEAKDRLKRLFKR